MVTNQKETSPWKRQNDDDVGTPEVNNPVPPEVNNPVPPEVNNSVPPEVNNSVPPEVNNAVPPEVNNTVPPEVNNTVVSREKGEMDIEIEPEEKRTKGNDEGDLDELMQEVGQDVDCQEERSDGTHQEENLDEGEERQEEQEQTEEGYNIEYIGMWCTEL